MAKKLAEEAKTEVPIFDLIKPIKPIKQNYPSVPQKDREITDKVPRVANYLRDLTLNNIFNFYNQNDAANVLKAFEQKCRSIDK